MADETTADLARLQLSSPSAAVHDDAGIRPFRSGAGLTYFSLPAVCRAYRGVLSRLFHASNAPPRPVHSRPSARRATGPVHRVRRYHLGGLLCNLVGVGGSAPLLAQLRGRIAAAYDHRRRSASSRLSSRPRRSRPTSVQIPRQHSLNGPAGRHRRPGRVCDPSVRHLLLDWMGGRPLPRRGDRVRRGGRRRRRRSGAVLALAGRLLRGPGVMMWCSSWEDRGERLVGDGPSAPRGLRGRTQISSTSGQPFCRRCSPDEHDSKFSVPGLGSAAIAEQSRSARPAACTLRPHHGSQELGIVAGPFRPSGDGVSARIEDGGYQWLVS